MEGKEKKTYYDEPYAITITFGYLKCKTPQGQFMETIGYITKILNRSCEFRIWPEWRVTTGHIHYHGTVWIKDKIKWFKDTIPKLNSLGYKLIKKIDDESKWETYCKKEENIAKDILSIEIPINKPIIYKSKHKKSFKGMSCIEILSNVQEKDLQTEIDQSDLSSETSQESKCP